MIHFYRDFFLSKNEFTKQDALRISALASKIDSIMNDENYFSWFVRMSNRSPKDGIIMKKKKNTSNKMSKGVNESRYN
jgi:hypothetical protein